MTPARAAKLLGKVRALIGAEREAQLLLLELLDDAAELLAQAEREMTRRAARRPGSRRAR